MVPSSERGAPTVSICSERTFDVFIAGATPGGIGAAIAAARRGRTVVLCEPTPFIGGMMTSGLGRTDIRSLDAAGAIFREFTTRVVDHYVGTYGPDSRQVRDCNRGLWFEPSVAAKVLWDMLRAERGIDLRTDHRVIGVNVGGGRLTAVTVRSSAPPSSPETTFRADVFIDATYEGDLAARAGVPYRLGRESRDEWNEEYAGTLYMDFHPSKEVFPGSTGEGDGRLQAYNFRLCLTTDPTNRAPVSRPHTYHREEYATLAGDIAADRVHSIRDVLNMLPIPNGKTDCNNHHYCMCSTDLPEGNGAYPDGDPPARAQVVHRHRAYIQGLLWFLQHDEALPEAFRADALQWGYAADEFTATDHFPPQIYVREARRIWGEYTFTENDARLAPGLGRAPIHQDSVAVGDYAIDSHATRKREPLGRDRALEGFLGLGWLTEKYQIPYGVMVPREIDGLLVPVAVSATHMGFGTIRMEPFWMQLGFAAGTAADLSLRWTVSPRDLPVDVLQDALLAGGQRITFFDDVPWEHPARIAVEYFGTKGLFTENSARLGEAMTVGEAARWIARARALPGGRGLPVLPAADGVPPAGVDMGPRLPTEEPQPQAKWAEHPQLTSRMGRRWLAAASRALGMAEGPLPQEEERAVTRGEFGVWLYDLLKAKRRERP